MSIAKLSFILQVVFNASAWSGSYIFEENSTSARFSGGEGNKRNQSRRNVNDQYIYKVQCFPLYSILLAVGKTEIDFLELDVEGSEYKILETIPWQRVNIKVISVINFYSNKFVKKEPQKFFPL
jgi:hypothetical protein